MYDNVYIIISIFFQKQGIISIIPIGLH